MTRRMQLFWRWLLAFFVACTLSGVGAWFVLLTTICSNPRKPSPETGHVVPYGCHGMTVYISGFEDAMLHWLTPLLLLLIALMVLSAGMAALSFVKVRVDVQVRYERGDRPGT